MRSGNAPHLSAEQLAQFQDGELTGQPLRHLELCVECRARLDDIRVAEAAYAEYRDTIRVPAMEPAPSPWPTLGALVAQHHPRRPVGILRWWPVAAVAAACCVLVLIFWPGDASVQATDLLDRSGRVQLPASRRIAVRMRGRVMMRPAVLMADMHEDAETQPLRALFVRAHYDWQEPLSARSFQAWRRALRSRRDAVTMIRAEGQAPLWRVTTDTSASVLRRASLTLRVRDLRPTNGTFRFEGEDELQIDEEAPVSPVEPPRARTPAAAPGVEIPAGPEDTLRVLDALERIDAGIEEPIDVSMDPRQGVLVQATGLSAQRQREIADALRALPHVSLRFDAAGSGATPLRAGNSEKYTSNIPANVRQRLEDRFGGPVAVQELTDRVLDVSASALARAHALQKLAAAFPPETEARLKRQDRDLLESLWRRHLAKLRGLIGRMRGDLAPLLAGLGGTTVNQPQQRWQERMPDLLAAVQETDRVLNRLLAGSYSEASADDMLRVLAMHIEYLERAGGQ